MVQPFSKPSQRHEIVFNPEICIWCRSCELMCSLHHEGICSPALSRIRISVDLFKAEASISVCKQCAEPACFYACPTQAIEVNDKTGAYKIDESRCTGCGSCAQACPLNTEGAIIRYNPSKNIYMKCDLCAGKPQCIDICPSGAVRYMGT